jgi:hypothetical protein
MTEESMYWMSRIRDDAWHSLVRIIREFFRTAPADWGYDIYTVSPRGEIGHIHICSEKDLAKRPMVKMKESERVEILQPSDYRSA